MGSTELIACLLTPGGRGAVASIGLRGDLERLDDSFQAVNGRSLQQQNLNRICFGHWGEEPREEVIFLRTSETEGEVHCHGGLAAVERILRDVRLAGGQVVDDNNWLRESQSETEAECQSTLMRATTQRTAHHLLRQCSLLPAAIRRLKEQLPPEQLRQIASLLEWSEFGRYLTIPRKVVLCGRPNVGKSSLINALVGFTRTVVFDQPGTTRDVVAVETAFNGWPVELSDTAGMRLTSGELEAAGIARAKERFSEANVIVIVLDAHAGLHNEDRTLLTSFPQALVVWNKSDLVDGPKHPELTSHHVMPVSALQKTGISALIEEVSQRLVPQIPDETTAFPVTNEQCQRLYCLREKIIAELQRINFEWAALRPKVR